MNIKQFDIVLADLRGSEGSEQKKTRPCVVMQNDIGNKHSTTTIAIPLTHVVKNLHLPTHAMINTVEANGLTVDPMIAGEQTRIIDKTRIIKNLGELTSYDAKIKAVEVYFANLLGIKYIPDELKEKILKGVC